MGGGGKGGGGSSVPPFVAEATSKLAERSQQLWDVSRPLVEQGTSQIASLVRTGGPGANVPIINNAVAAQQAAGRQAQEGAATQMQRGGVPSNIQNRIQERIRQNTSSAARSIPVSAAAPLIGAAMTGAMTGGNAATQGFQGASQALAAGQRQPQRSQAAMSAGSNLAKLAMFGAGGGFSDISFGGKTPNTTNPYGSGISPTGSFILGSSGMLGGGV